MQQGRRSGTCEHAEAPQRLGARGVQACRTRAEGGLTLPSSYPVQAERLEADLDADLETLEAELRDTPCEDTHVRPRAPRGGCVQAGVCGARRRWPPCAPHHKGCCSGWASRLGLAEALAPLRGAGDVRGVGGGGRVHAESRLYAVRLPRCMRAVRGAARGHAGPRRRALAAPAARPAAPAGGRRRANAATTASSFTRACGGSALSRAWSAAKITSAASHSYSAAKCARSPCTSPQSSCRTPAQARHQSNGRYVSAAPSSFSVPAYIYSRHANHVIAWNLARTPVAHYAMPCRCNL